MNDRKNEQGTHSTKMGADILAENTPQMPQNLFADLSAQGQKFGISMKKGFIGRLVRGPHHQSFRNYIREWAISASKSPN